MCVYGKDGKFTLFFCSRVLEAFDFIVIQKTDIRSLSSLYSPRKEMVVSGRRKG